MHSVEAPSATGTAQGAAAAEVWPADSSATGGGMAGGTSCFTRHGACSLYNVFREASSCRWEGNLYHALDLSGTFSDRQHSHDQCHKESSDIVQVKTSLT